jgi:hypothetical protein
MKNTVLLAGIIFLAISNLFSNEKTFFWECSCEINLEDVEGLTFFRFDVEQIQDSIKTEIDVSYMYKFDANGNILEEHSFPGNKLTESSINKYDSYGNIIEELYYYRDENTESGSGLKLGSRYKYKYYNGKLSQRLFYSGNDSLLKQTVYKYDADGHLSNKKLYDYDENSIAEIRKNYFSYENHVKKIIHNNEPVGEPPAWHENYEYKYDSNGNLMQENMICLFLNEVEQTNYTYDGFGNITKTVKRSKKLTHPSMDPFEFVETYKYDENNNLVEHTTYYSGELYDNEKINYSTNGRKTKTERFIKGRLHETTNYGYDPKGNLIEVKIYNVAWNVRNKKIYKYDKMNNPVKFYYFKDDIAQEVVVINYQYSD